MSDPIPAPAETAWADDNLPWYSDAALAKQAEIDRLQAAGEPVPVTMLRGLWAPRVPPAPDERCFNCGLDARDKVGGKVYHQRRWCALCVSRGRPLDWDCEVPTGQPHL